MNCLFNSFLAGEIQAYIDFKCALGYSALSYEKHLRRFDEFCCKHYPEEKTQLVAKCILNHSSKRAQYRTTQEEELLVCADGLAHFDAYKSLYSLAHKVMGLNDEESLKFIQDKLTKDYAEIREDLKSLVDDTYARVMNAKTIGEILHED